MPREGGSGRDGPWAAERRRAPPSAVCDGAGAARGAKRPWRECQAAGDPRHTPQPLPRGRSALESCAGLDREPSPAPRGRGQSTGRPSRISSGFSPQKFLFPAIKPHGIVLAVPCLLA